MISSTELAEKVDRATGRTVGVHLLIRSIRKVDTIGLLRRCRVGCGPTEPTIKARYNVPLLQRIPVTTYFCYNVPPLQRIFLTMYFRYNVASLQRTLVIRYPLLTVTYSLYNVTSSQRTFVTICFLYNIPTLQRTFVTTYSLYNIISLQTSFLTTYSPHSVPLYPSYNVDFIYVPSN